MKNKKEEKKVSDKLFLLTLFLVLVLIGGFAVNNENILHVSESTNLLPNTSETEKISEKEPLNTSAISSKLLLSISPKITINEDGLTGQISVHNPSSNKVGQQALIIDEDGQVIGHTGLIKPGYQASQIKLDREMSKGSHEVSVRLKFYDLEQKKEVASTVVLAMLSVGI